MRFLLISIIVIGLAGCSGPSFQVRQLNDSYDGITGQVLSGSDNRISSQSITGGTHIDASGMFLDPVAHVAEDGSIVASFFWAAHRTTNDSFMRYGGIQSVAIKADGELIRLVPSSSNLQLGDVEYNTVSRSAGYAVTETAMLPVTIAQIRQIAEAGTISIKVTGGQQAHVYEPQAIAASFQPNLQAFLQAIEGDLAVEASVTVAPSATNRAINPPKPLP